MAFRGWPVAAIEFYEGLEADNSRTYWHANKQTYEQIVKGPMDALLAELAPEFGAGRIFRPNRDVRFSRDKSPYKTAIAATLEEGGYVQFSADGLSAGTGLYMPATDQLDRYRRAVADDRSGAALVDIVADARRTGIEITAHESLKTAPAATRRTIPGSSCSARRASSPGSSGRSVPGWARRRRRTASSRSCTRRRRSPAGSTSTSARRRSPPTVADRPLAPTVGMAIAVDDEVEAFEPQIGERPQRQSRKAAWAAPAPAPARSQ